VAGSTNQVDIVKEKLLRFKLFLPSLALQNRFADFVQATDKSKFILRETLKLATKYIRK
jgi:restriction endonuclease S subunit